MIFLPLLRNHFKSAWLNLVTHLVQDLWLVLLLSALLPTGAEDIDVNIPLVRDFQKIGEGPEKLFVYSAYFDEYRGKDRASVRILGGVKTVFPRPLYCKFYNKDGQHYSTVEAEVRAISENFGFEYSASFITCRVLDFYTLPSFVSLMESAKHPQKMTNLLKVKYPEERKREEKIRFAVCVQPTYNYDRPLRFAEWMEFHKLMGVEKFMFYNVSIGEETSCLMQSYGDEIEILPWTSSYKPEEEIRMHSQFIGAQDCLYRSRGMAEYMIYVDLDEMIVPRRGSNYSQFFDFLERELSHRLKFNQDIASFNFRNGFFFDGWDDDSNLHKMRIHGDSRADNILRQLQITKKTRRAKETEPHDIRSKFIVFPEKAIELGNHAVFEAAGNAMRIAVPEELAYSHHYRVCLEDQCQTRHTIVERSAQRFSEQVAQLVADRIYSKAKHCRILVDDDEEEEQVDVPNALDTSPKLPQPNSNQYPNSSYSDWSLTNLLYSNFFPGTGSTWKESPQHPGFSNVANPVLSMSTLSTNPIQFSSEVSPTAESVAEGKDIHSEALPSVNYHASEIETSDSQINSSEWMMTVENPVKKNQEAPQHIDQSVPSSAESLDLPHNISSPETRSPASVPSDIADEQTAQDPKEDLFI